MRLIFVGAGALSVTTAQNLFQRGHEVVIIERDREAIQGLSEQLDCGFLHGDATRPALLREADPENADALLCLTGSDQVNLIASLLGRSLGIPRVITRIADEEFEHICIELGLTDTVIPNRTTGRYLADVVEGRDILDVSSVFKGDARVLVFVARDEDQGEAAALHLPEDARVTHLYRKGDLVLVDPNTEIVKGDEVVVLSHARHEKELRKRWLSSQRNG